MSDIGTELKTVVTPDGAAVLDMRRGSISTLNPTGAYVWLALERGESEEAIVESLARETGMSPEVIGPDVRKFMEALMARDLRSPC